MPPKTTLPSPTAQIPLQEWLKLLSGRGVDMRVAMQLAAKIYKSHGTIERLSELSQQKLATLIDDKEARKNVYNAVRGLATGQTVSKKRGRDSDLLQPLGQRQGADVPVDMEFHPVFDIEELLPLTLTTNRSPVKTAWAYTLCIRMGFDHLESLSIAHVYVHISSLKHALKLGNILDSEKTREAEQELRELPGAEKESWVKKEKEKEKWRARGRGKDREERDERPVGSAQPWVGIMGHKPIIERPDGTCRAIQQGEPVAPSQAYLYITRTFKTNTPHVMGAMKIVADSYEVEELNRLASHMYNEFKPDVAEWGQRGTLELAKVLDEAKGPVDELSTTNEQYPVMKKKSGISDSQEEGKSESEHKPDEAEPEPPNKKARGMTVEEYEDMLDAEGEGGYLEGGDW